MSQTQKKSKWIKRYGVLRFECIACGFEVHPSPGVPYKGANEALGKAGWRIEKRGDVWGSVCNKCAAPDEVIRLPPPQESAA